MVWAFGLVVSSFMLKESPLICHVVFHILSLSLSRLCDWPDLFHLPWINRFVSFSQFAPRVSAVFAALHFIDLNVIFCIFLSSDVLLPVVSVFIACCFCVDSAFHY